MKTPFPETHIPRGMSAAEVERVLGLSHHFGGGVFVKMARFARGDILVQHKHTFEHLSVLVAGTVEVLVDGVRTVHDAKLAPVVLTIAAGKHHGVKALTPGFWLCIHATDETDPERVDHTLVSADSSEADMGHIAEALR